MTSSSLGHLGVVEELVSHPETQVNIPDAYGVRPLHIAVRRGFPLSLLRKRGHKSNNSLFISPFHSLRDLKVVNCLLGKGEADAQAETITGNTPLHDACEEPNPLIAKSLLEVLFTPPHTHILLTYLIFIYLFFVFFIFLTFYSVWSEALC